MKHIKKVLALALALAMVLAMSTLAVSADGTKKITLKGGKAGHTYTLYQVFKGTVEENTLTNIQWGSGVTDVFKATKSTAAAYAEEIKEENDARATAQALISANALTSGTEKTLNEDGDVVFDNLEDGYYVVVDTNGNNTAQEGDYSSAVIVEVVKTIEINLKGSAATAEKKVKDVNDTLATSESNPTGWQDSADYDIGDAVPFLLKAKVADNVAAYKKYHITFQDTQSSGLNEPESFTIQIPAPTQNETITLAYNATQAVTKEVTFGEGENAVTVVVKAEKVTPDTGKTFAIKVSFENKVEGKYLPASLNRSEIDVEYTSVLNSSAVMGKAGNPNEMFIYYSSNPESATDSEEGKTPVDKVIVFTYSLKVNKTDEINTPLKGAGFTLYKKNSAGNYEAVGSEVKGEDITSFVWTGLDDGSYKLEETTVPAGYNKATDITFDITAEHDVDLANPQLTAIGVSNITPEGTTFSINLEPGESEANISTTVVNKSGAELPTTGGIGTVIFYVVGAALVIGCGIVLISRRRVSGK